MPRAIEDRAKGVVAKPAAVVHARLADVATLAATQLDAFPIPKSRIVDWLGLRNGFDLRLVVRPGDGGISFETTRGRIRLDGHAMLAPHGLDQSDIDVAFRVRPVGLIGRVLWWVADRAGLLQDANLELGAQMAEIVEGLGAPDGEWAAIREQIADAVQKGRLPAGSAARQGAG